MRPVDSQVLGTIARTLGLAGRGSQITEFDDGLVQQVLDVAGLIRRGGTLAASEGLWAGTIINVHAGATSETEVEDPYAPSVAVAPYPAVVPEGYDFWIFGARAWATTGGLFGGGRLDLRYVEQMQAFGPAGNRDMQIVTWDAEDTIQSTEFLAEAGSGLCNVSFGQGIRVPRGSSIRFTTTATAAETYELNMFCGLFPAGLGTDGRG